MPTLKSIKKIGFDNRELLEAAGWSDLRQLARAKPEDVRAELVKANGVLHLAKKVPSVTVVTRWVNAARELIGEESEGYSEKADPSGDRADKKMPSAASEEQQVPEPPSEPVNYEADPDVQDMLDRAPVAIPIPNRLLAEKGIKPTEIEIAPVLNRAQSDLELRVTASVHKKKRSSAPGTPRGKSGGVVQVADFVPGSKMGIDTSRIRSIEDTKEEGPVAPLERAPRDEDDRLTLLRTARESTNRGRSPESEFYIRGVLHDRPYKVWLGCLVVVIFQLLVPLALVAAPLLILSDSLPESFSWVPNWFLAFPIALPVFGLLYLMMAMNVKCRVCGQKVLVPRHCRKNKKAHHVPGLGFILPLAVHTLVYRWFNCTFCGTSVRIKE